MRLIAVVFTILSLVSGPVPAAAGSDSSSARPQANGPVASQEEGGLLAPASSTAAGEGVTHPIYLRSRTIQPEPDQASLEPLVPSGAERAHILVQLDFIPREAAKDELARQGLELLDYLPEYAWIAVVNAGVAPDLLNLPGVVWAGSLQVDDKLDEAIREDRWSSFNSLAEDRVAVYVMLHIDESLETGRGLVAKHDGQVVCAVGANLLVVEMPRGNLRARQPRRRCSGSSRPRPSWGRPTTASAPRSGSIPSRPRLTT